MRQHREGPGFPLWEIPAGVLEGGERPLAAAQRELSAETSLTARRWRYLVPHARVLRGSTYLFLAEEPSGEPAARSEVDGAGFFSTEDIHLRARIGRRDAKTLPALALAGQSGSPLSSPRETQATPGQSLSRIPERPFPARSRSPR